MATIKVIPSNMLWEGSEGPVIGLSQGSEDIRLPGKRLQVERGHQLKGQAGTYFVPANIKNVWKQCQVGQTAGR